jgi:tRNA dimethylallyltransferase
LKTFVIVGPTASGKTTLSIKLAKQLNGQIIAADSRTIYKEMNIGTAKPTIKETQNIKHYGLDLVYPNEPYNVSLFNSYAKEAMSHIINDGCLPIVVGGSGLFVDSLIYNFTFSKPDLEKRKIYNNKTIEELQDLIIKENIEMPNNYKNKLHLVSALERSGQPKPNKNKLLNNTVIIGINPAKEILKNNITIRAQQMLNDGVIKEAEYLFNKYGSDCNAFNGGIYKLIPKYLNGDYTKSMLIEEFIKSDLKLAKKQMTWFKRNQSINWFSKTSDAIAWVKKERVQI